jgi:CheY-like chemotaxis protein
MTARFPYRVQLPGINDCVINVAINVTGTGRMPPLPAGTGAFFYVLQDPLKILFVDDDPILREFAQVHLTTDAAQVRVAADGLEALEALESYQADAVLLDLEMPGMDGFEALDRLRADPRYASLPVIVVTGREDVAAVDRAFEAGATSFVVKPLNWRLLSYQLRYVHRATLAEQARRQAEALMEERLLRVCAESSRFLAVALGANPELRPAAADYADALEAATG